MTQLVTMVTDGGTLGDAESDDNDDKEEITVNTLCL